MHSTGEKSVLAYAKYATVSDVWAAVHEQWVVFPTWGIVLFILGWLNERAPDSSPGSSWLPDWLFWAMVFAAGLWLWRGQTFNVPNVSLLEWVTASIGAFVTAAITKYMPWWVASLWVAFLVATWRILDRTNDFGQKRLAEAEEKNSAPA